MVLQMNEADIQNLSRKELQKLAKYHGLKANKKSSELIAELTLLSQPGKVDTTEPTNKNEFSIAINSTTFLKEGSLTPSLNSENIHVNEPTFSVGDYVEALYAGQKLTSHVKRINKKTLRLVLSTGDEITVAKSHVRVLREVEMQAELQTDNDRVLVYENLTEVSDRSREPFNISDESRSCPKCADDRSSVNGIKETVELVPCDLKGDAESPAVKPEAYLAEQSVGIDIDSQPLHLREVIYFYLNSQRSIIPSSFIFSERMRSPRYLSRSRG